MSKQHGGGEARRHVEERAPSQVLNQGPSKQGLGGRDFIHVSEGEPLKISGVRK